jgi:hypothetical protein
VLEDVTGKCDIVTIKGLPLSGIPYDQSLIQLVEIVLLNVRFPYLYAGPFSIREQLGIRANSAPDIEHLFVFDCGNDSLNFLLTIRTANRHTYLMM